MRRVLLIVFVGLVLVSGVVFLIKLTSTEPAAPPKAVAAPAAPPEFPPARDVRAAPPPPTSTRSRAPVPTPAAAPPPTAPVEAPPTTATLRIDCDVPGALVFIDRVYIGTAPVTAPEVTPGSHRLNVSSAGYDGVAEDIDVTPGPRDITIRLKDVRLDAKIEVIHKHLLGSSKGTLSATPQGLHYETMEKNDAFDAPLLNIEAIQVDYLAKNLKVKIRNGKSYDFTDPEGNADRLFNFRSEVAKAIEKLKKGG